MTNQASTQSSEKINLHNESTVAVSRTNCDSKNHILADGMNSVKSCVYECFSCTSVAL